MRHEILSIRLPTVESKAGVVEDLATREFLTKNFLTPLYAQNSASFRSGEIRILDSTGKLEHTIAFNQKNRKL